MTYRYGVESVVTSISSVKNNSLVMVGTAKYGNYNILILKVKPDGEKIWERLYSGKKDYEGHYIVSTANGYLISGCAEGIASPTGGQNWKAYLLKVDDDGNKEWEKFYSILGNDCAYSVLQIRDGYFLFGTTKEQNESLFLLKIDKEGNKIWHRTYGDAEVMLPAGIVANRNSYVIGGSMWNRKKWQGYLSKVDQNGEVLWEKTFRNVTFFNMCSFGDYIAIVGEKEKRIYLAKLNKNGDIIWERIYEKGAGIAIEKSKSGFIVGGEMEERPFIYRVSDDGELETKIVEGLWRKGWIETIKRTVPDSYIVAGQIILEDGNHIGMVKYDEKI